MMKKIVFSFIFLFTLIKIFPQHAKVLKFGDEKINLPIIPGYTECGSEEDIQSFFETLIPENSELVGFYLNNADYQYKDAFVADHELNTVACMTEIMMQVKFK